MNKKIKTEAVDCLFDAVLSLKTKEECYSFFEDLCTVNELLSLSQRFEVAAMLRDHKTYLDIAEKTGASTATISRVNRSLNYGNDGYELVFERMSKKKRRKERNSGNGVVPKEFSVRQTYSHLTDSKGPAAACPPREYAAAGPFYHE